MERKLNAIIVDDESHARENLKMLLQEFCEDVKVESAVSSAREGIQLVEQIDPDLVFLDIMMPVKDGFGFLDHFEERDFEVIFTTAHNEHALKAIKRGATDYLEKPINIDDLMEAVNKAKERVELRDKAEAAKAASQASSHRPIDVEKVPIATRDGVAFVSNKEIVHIESTGKGSIVHLEDGREIETSKNIKSFEDRLNKEVFFRLHRSHLINILFHLKEYKRELGGRAELSNGRELPIARRKLTQFLDRMHV